MVKAVRRSHNVLITGATDGIGLLLTKAYSSRGHRVLATGRRGIANDQAFFGSPNVTYVSADQTNPKHAADIILDALEDMGWKDLDLAILNAATAWAGPPFDEPVEIMAHQLDVNFTAQIHIIHSIALHLFAVKGKLVIVGSTSVKKPRGSFATYTATKAALDGFCRSLHEEWQDRASVSIVHPGPTRTRMHEKAGMKTGISRLFFMSPKRVSRAIQMAIRDGDKRRMITRTYGWQSLLSRAGKGQL